jgi:hypothetical protein
MALVTASEIVTNVSTHGITTALIKSADIEASEYNRIRTALGSDFYDTVVADAVTYATITGYLKKALSYFVVADIIERINTEISDRGLFGLTADSTRAATRDDVSAVKRELLRQGNGFLSMAIGWAEDNSETDYTSNMTESETDYTYPMAFSNTARNTRL